MIIAVDCDEVILNTNPMMKKAYLRLINPAADIPDHAYSSVWSVFGDGENQRKNWNDFLNLYADSPYFTMAAAVPGASEGLRALKSAGHRLFVVSCAGNAPELIARRRAHIESVFGGGVFEDVICIAPFESKSAPLIKIGARVLVDDGARNIVSAIESGVRGIWFRCPENDHIARAIEGGGGSPMGHFWPFDPKLLRTRALIAHDWGEVAGHIKTIGEAHEQIQ